MGKQAATDSLPQKYLPQFRSSSRVGERTRDWWQAIGQSLLQFTEIEQLVIDWAVRFSGDKSLWTSKFMDDLKALVPVLRNSLKKAGGHRLTPSTRNLVDRALADIEALSQARNDIAHMRLRFAAAPVKGSEAWILTASHVEVRKRRGERIVLAHRDLQWIQSTVGAAKDAGKFFHATMCQAWSELQAEQANRVRK